MDAENFVVAVPEVPFVIAVMTSYTAEKETEMSVSEGDVVRVTDGSTSNDWFYGELQGPSNTSTQRGWFPRTSTALYGDKIVTIKAPYTASKNTEISVRQGERLIITERHGEWVCGSSVSNLQSSGWFPGFCIGDGASPSAMAKMPSSESTFAFAEVDQSDARGRSSSLPRINSPSATSPEQPRTISHNHFFVDHPRRSVSLGGRSLGSNAEKIQKSFFGNDTVYKRIIEKQSSPPRGSPSVKDDEALAMSLQLQEIKRSKQNNSAHLSPPLRDDEKKSAKGGSPPTSSPKVDSLGMGNAPTCSLCKVKHVSVAVAPCWHTCLCDVCSEKVTHCVKCNTKIERRQKMFL